MVMSMLVFVYICINKESGLICLNKVQSKHTDLFWLSEVNMWGCLFKDTELNFLSVF